MNAQLELIEFTALDRCDRCNAQAHHAARKEGLSDLLFCGHHLKRHIDSLLDSGWTILSDNEGVKNLKPRTVQVNY